MVLTQTGVVTVIYNMVNQWYVMNMKTVMMIGMTITITRIMMMEQQLL